MIFNLLLIWKILDPDPKSTSLMRLRIRGGQSSTDSCGSGSATLANSILLQR